MNECPPDQRLEVFLAEGLSPSECEALEEHLAECPRCQQRLHELTSEPVPSRWRELFAYPQQNDAPSDPAWLDHLAQLPLEQVAQEPHAAATQAWVAAGDAETPSSDGGADNEELSPQPVPVPWPVVPGYEVLGNLGRGGMGVVYQARQTGVNRLVALKMIRAGEGAGAEELARFRREAEAAGRLQHPNLVQIYEVGTHAGLPYLCLEYVDGGNLAELVAGLPHPARPAAALMQLLARAMHYAHEHGIVHRDLKPANILLQSGSTPEDAEERRGNETARIPPRSAAFSAVKDFIPKISDFGLAKLLHEEARLTRTGLVLGTPSYMAPEQVLPGRQSIGPAADVYALGAILYELLCGRPPFVGETPLHTAEQVVHAEPVPLRRLHAKIPRDLETITLKCLAKEPGQRYSTARALADDLRRYLEDKPIKARRLTPQERAAKWARRHKTVVRAAMLLLVVAMIGLAVSTFLIMQQRDVAEASRRRAEQILDTAYRSLDKIYLAWAEKRLPQATELTAEDRQFLEDALAFYMKFAHQDSSKAQGRQKAAEAYLRVAIIQSQLGQDAEAKGNYRQALEAFRGLVDEYPNDPIYRCHLGRCLSEMADMIFHPLHFDTMKENDEAFRQAIKLQERLMAEDSTSVDYRHDLALSYSRFGSHLHNNYSRYNEAEPLFRSARTLLSSLAEEHPSVVTYRQDYCDVLGKLAWLWEHTGRLQQAGQLFGESLDLRKKLVHDFPGQPYPRLCLGWGYENLAEWQLVTRRLEDGAETCRQAVDVRAKLAADFAGVQIYRQHLAISYRMLGDSIKELGRPESALTWYDQAISTLTNVPVERQLHMARGARAVALLQLGRVNEAGHAFKELEQIYDKAVQLDPTNFWNWVFDAELHLHLGDLEGYRGVCREMLARFGHTDNPIRANATAKACLLAPAAVSDLGPILQLAERDFPEQNLFYCYNVLVKGMVEYRAGHFDTAIDRLNQTLSLGREPRYCNPRSLSGTAYAFLAMAHHRLGRVAEARQALDQATQLVEQPYSKIDWNWSCERIWHDWLIFYVARQEAEKLLKGEASP
jgi:serine/threonine protein kinase/Flp pilus assembly protein TadD